MTTKLLIAALAAVMMATPVAAQNAAQSAIILNGIVSHGSVVCNVDWLDRRGSRMILALAQSYKSTPNAGALLDRGFRDFDNRVRQDGKASACRELDGAIRFMESPH